MEITLNIEDYRTYRDSPVNEPYEKALNHVNSGGTVRVVEGSKTWGTASKSEELENLLAEATNG